MSLQLRTNAFLATFPEAPLSSSGCNRRIQRMGGGRPHMVLRLVATVNGGGDGDGSKKKAMANSNYVVPFDKSFSSSSISCITRPLVEILRDLNKRIPENTVRPPPSYYPSSSTFFIPWYHANRMLSFYAPGWCGEIRDIISSSDNESVTVVYRLTIRGSDGEAHRESTGTVSSSESIPDPVAAAEEIAFCRACARFGLGLYLYHEE